MTTKDDFDGTLDWNERRETHPEEYAEEGETVTNEKKPVVVLVGTDGNAFSIIAKCRTAARRAGWSLERTSEVTKEMMSGTYDTVLQTAMKHFDVR
jgi:hypothetical protein